MSGWETPHERWREWVDRDATLEHPVWVSCDDFDDNLRGLLEARPFADGTHGRAKRRAAEPAQGATSDAVASGADGNAPAPTVFGANGARTGVPSAIGPDWTVMVQTSPGEDVGGALSEPELEGLFIPTLTRSALAQGDGSPLSPTVSTAVPISGLLDSGEILVPDASESVEDSDWSIDAGPPADAWRNDENEDLEVGDVVHMVTRAESESAIELDEAELVEEEDPDVPRAAHISGPVERRRPPAPPPVREETSAPEGAGETESVLAALHAQQGGLTSRELEERASAAPTGRVWFEDVFADHYSALARPSHNTMAQAEAEFFLLVTGLGPGRRVVDVGCGDGAHAIALAQRGLEVTGLDLSAAQLLRASKAAEAFHVGLRFMHADMRTPMLEGAAFDGLLCMGTTFGYFEEDENRRLLQQWREWLVPGGRALIHVANRDHVVARLPARSWWQGRGCLVLDEAEMDFFTNRIQIQRNIAFNDGRQFRHDMSIRVYSAYELGHMCASAGLRVVEISGSRLTRGRFYGATSSEIWLVVERPA